jgi:hypothetical protein
MTGGLGIQDLSSKNSFIGRKIYVCTKKVKNDVKTNNIPTW